VQEVRWDGVALNQQDIKRCNTEKSNFRDNSGPTSNQSYIHLDLSRWKTLKQTGQVLIDRRRLSSSRFFRGAHCCNDY
jgi:hypothetical protein